MEETLNVLNTGQPAQPYQVNLSNVTWSLIHVRQLLGASGWGNVCGGFGGTGKYLPLR